MTVSKSPRLGLTRWSDDSDPWDRADWDSDNAALEAQAVAYVHEAYDPPSADPDNAGTFWRELRADGSVEQLYYSDGITWRRVALLDGPSAITDPTPDAYTGSGYMLTLHNIAATDVTPGNLDVRYRHATNDNADVLAATIIIGSTTNLGTAGGQLTIRGIHAPELEAAGIDTRIPAVIQQASTGDVYDALLIIPAAATYEAKVYARTGAGKMVPVTTAVPFAWAAGDSLTLGPVTLPQTAP